MKIKIIGNKKINIFFENLIIRIENIKIEKVEEVETPKTINKYKFFSKFFR